MRFKLSFILTFMIGLNVANALTLEECVGDECMGQVFWYSDGRYATKQLDADVYVSGIVVQNKGELHFAGDKTIFLRLQNIQTKGEYGLFMWANGVLNGGDIDLDSTPGAMDGTASESYLVFSVDASNIDNTRINLKQIKQFEMKDNALIKNSTINITGQTTLTIKDSTFDGVKFDYDQTKNDHNNIISNMHIKNSTLNFNNISTYLNFGGTNLVENSTISGAYNGDRTGRFMFAVSTSDSRFVNSVLNDVNFDRFSGGQPDTTLRFENSMLNNVYIGVKDKGKLIKELVIDNSIIKNDAIDAGATPSIKVANLTLQNINGGGIDADIKITQSTDPRDNAALKDKANTGLIKILNSTIDQKARINADRYALERSTYTPSAPIDADALSMTNGSIIHGDISRADTLQLDSSAINGDISAGNMQMTSSQIHGDISASSISANNSQIHGNISASSIRANSSHIYGDASASTLSASKSRFDGRVVVDDLDVSDSEFYMYGGGLDSSLADSYSGAIIARRSITGSGNTIYIAHTNLGLLSDINIPLVIANGMDEPSQATQPQKAAAQPHKAAATSASKPAFSVVYKTALASYDIKPEYIHYQSIGGAGIIEIGKGKSIITPQIITNIKQSTPLSGQAAIINGEGTRAVDKSSQRVIIADMFSAPKYERDTYDAIWGALEYMSYAVRSDIGASRYQAYLSDEPIGAIWGSATSSYTTSIKLRRTGFDIGIDRLYGSSMVGMAISLASMRSSEKIALDGRGYSVGAYAMSRFDSGVFVGADAYYHSVHTDIDAPALDLRTHKVSSAYTASARMGARLGEMVYIQPSIEYVALGYKPRSIVAKDIHIAPRAQLLHSIGASMAVGARAGGWSIDASLGASKQLNKTKAAIVSDEISTHELKAPSAQSSIKTQLDIGYASAKRLPKEPATRKLETRLDTKLGFGYEYHQDGRRDYNATLRFVCKF